MAEPIYLSDATRLKYAQRRSTGPSPWLTPTGWDGSAVLRGVMRFSVEYAAAMASFHASLLKIALSPWSKRHATGPSE